MVFIPKHIAVLGGGITGLCAAYKLTQLGHSVRIFEKDSSLGGSIKTELSEGYLIEKGPNSLQESEELSNLISELGLQSERIEASTTAKNRYLVKEGRLIAVPMGIGSFIKTPLLSWHAKLSVFKELFHKKKSRKNDLSLADFVRDHFGDEILAQAVQPMVSGVYAGDPEALSMRNAFPRLLEYEENNGSLILGLIGASKRKKKTAKSGPPKLISFKKGLATLPEALASQLKKESILLETTVTGISRENTWSVTYTYLGSEHTESFDSIISTLPAFPLSQLAFDKLSTHPLSVLSNVSHPAVTSLFLGFKRSAIQHPLDGFGALIPSREKMNSLGILFSSSLFEGRSPKDCACLTVMLGGSLNSSLALENESVLLNKVMADLKQLLGITEDPLFIRKTLWPKAIAQYNLGYETMQKTFQAVEEAFPGFYVGGQLRDGISVPDCIRAGFKLALKTDSELAFKNK
jgi:oxygen-dependent protoporphyrinogen oxidase